MTRVSPVVSVFWPVSGYVSLQHLPPGVAVVWLARPIPWRHGKTHGIARVPTPGSPGHYSHVLHWSLVTCICDKVQYNTGQYKHALHWSLMR